MPPDGDFSYLVVAGEIGDVPYCVLWAGKRLLGHGNQSVWWYEAINEATKGRVGSLDIGPHEHAQIKQILGSHGPKEDLSTAFSK